MNELGFKIPNLIEVINFVVFIIIPALVIVPIIIKLVLRVLLKVAHKNWSRKVINLFISLILPVYIFLDTINNINILPAAIMYYLILSIIIFILLSIADLLIQLNLKMKILLLVFFIPLYVFLYPKKIADFKINYEGKYAEYLDCKCIGLDRGDEYLKYCYGIPYSCQTTIDREYCAMEGYCIPPEATL